MLAAEVSLYPQKSKECAEVIKRSVEVLGEQGLRYEVGPVSTFVEGDSDRVWSGLRSVFEAAGRQGCEVNMVVQMRET
ncbi:MAG TPA: YkoF family thiamine/hydroxymethylpyrimidine-binding protein [Bacillota bacterium]|jgi:uncharacterized protein YqgV (UPF0045/DUF77 family)